MRCGPGDAYFNKLVRIMATRCMTQAAYFGSGEAAPAEYYHYGLAAPLYTHFTSPIRRSVPRTAQHHCRGKAKPSALMGTLMVANQVLGFAPLAGRWDVEYSRLSLLPQWSLQACLRMQTYARIYICIYSWAMVACCMRMCHAKSCGSVAAPSTGTVHCCQQAQQLCMIKALQHRQSSCLGPLCPCRLLLDRWVAS